MKKEKSASPFDALKPLRDELGRREKEKDKVKDKGAAAPTTAQIGDGRTRKASPSAPQPAPSSTDDDAMLFHRMFAGVEPLDRSRGRIPMQSITRSAAVDQAAARNAELAKAEAEAVHAHLRALVEGPERFEVRDDGRRVEGRRIDTPIERLRTLRRGQMPIDSRLDLHGRSAPQAHAELDGFLKVERARGERCVLVIHGKGEHSPGGAGVLRGEIAAWLSQGPASEHVAAFATAQPDDGGEGAVYVLLRR